MIRRAFGTAAIVLCTAIASQSAAAQDGFKPGYMDIGPTLGFGNLGHASTAFGARFEKGIKELPSMGNGVLGIQVGLNYYSWNYFSANSKFIVISGTANYHFKLDDKKWDPFIGLGLAYSSISCSYPGSGVDYCEGSALDLAARGGVRYFFSPSMSGYADVGAGGATLNLGVMFKLQ